MRSFVAKYEAWTGCETRIQVIRIRTIGSFAAFASQALVGAQLPAKGAVEGLWKWLALAMTRCCEFDPNSPSMPLVYRHAKDANHQQLEHGAHLDSKARTVFAIASAIVGFVVPLIFTQVKSIEDSLVLAPLALLLVTYVVGVYLFWMIYKGRPYRVADDPRTVGRYTLAKNQSATYRKLFMLMRNAYATNEQINVKKARYFQFFFWIAISEIGLAVVCSFLLAAPSLWS